MNIAILCYPSIGGSGLVATELGLDLARRGHEVHFISYSSPFKLPHYARNVFFHSVDPINYPLFNQSLYTFSLTAKVIEVVNDYHIDIVHAHYSIPHSLCAHLAREITGKRFGIVTTLHGTDVTIVGQDKPLFPINRYGIVQSDRITTVSEFQRQHTLKYFDIQKEIRVIHNFVDLAVFRPGGNACARNDLAAPDEGIVMHISNFRQPKNPVGVIHSFHLARQQTKARLVLVGDGPEIVTIRHHCREHGICDHITYLGKVDRVEDILPLADVVVQPSYHESFGVVLLEAMACEVPTVSSNVDGIPEVVADGETGLTAGPDDHAQLAAHLVRLLRDADLRRRFGAAGRARAQARFSQEHIVPRYLACYEELL